ncbi:MAG TPA: amino acid permease [Spirochaetota bacterium]|nr:amino acid permease [Spirochaetota bacterium]
MKKFDTEVHLAREMTLMDATLIGVGAMIGAGIFVLIGIAAGVAGPALLLTFVLNGLIALLTAMSYAELGSCYHDAGGGYLWVKEGLPAWNGFMSGWMSWFAHAVACSLYALGFGAYFNHVLGEFSLYIPNLGFFSPQKILAASTAVLFAYINFRGASETGKVGNLVTIAKIIILLIFVGFGVELILRNGDWRTTFSPFMPNGIGGVFKAMGLTFIAFQGFEVIAQSSEEINNPKKNIPRAVFLSLIIVVPIYLLVAIVALGSITPPEGMTSWDFLAQQKETALVGVARHFFTGGGVMILIGGLISTISALNATIFSSSRVAFAMGRDRNFPAFFSKVHDKNFTPHWSILVSLIIIVVMAVSFPIEDVASAADIMFLLLFLQVNVAMIRLRKKRPDLDRGFKVPLFPVLTILGILLLLFLSIYMFNYSYKAWIVTGIWIAIGLVVYRGYAAQREVEHLQKVQALEKIERKEYRILVCLSNPRFIPSITSIALAIAKKHNAEVIFLHVIEIPEGKKLNAGIDDTVRVKSVLERAGDMADAAGIDSKSIIKISHRISQGIVDTALEERCNFIITGRKKETTFLNRMFSSIIDTVLQKTPTEVAILHDEFKKEKIKTIMIPLGDDVHTRLATEIAPGLLEFFNARLKIVLIVNPRATDLERREKVERMNTLIKENNLRANIEIINDMDIYRGIIRGSRGADLIVMSGRSGDFIEMLFAKSLIQEVTEQAACPVLWVKEYEERVSFFKSVFRPYKKELER